MILKLPPKLPLLAALSAALLLVFACSSEEAPSSDTDTAPESLVITEGGNTDFYIIRSDYAKSAEVDLAVKVRRCIIDETGASPGISTDWEKNPTYEHEIIIGKTLRDTAVPIDPIALGETGYVIKEENGRIFIVGGSDKGTALGVDRFLDTYITGDSSSIPIGTDIVVYHQYDIPELYINSKLVDSSYRIIVPTNAGKNVNAAAERLRDALYAKTGLYLSIAEGDSNAKNAFVISELKPEAAGMHEIRVSDSSILFTTGSSRGVAACVDIFITQYISDTFGRINFPSDFRYYDIGDYIIVTYPDQAKK